MLVKAVSQAELQLAGASTRLADTQAALERWRSEDYSDIRAGRLDSEVKDMAERDRKLESEILTITKAREDKLKHLAEDQEKQRKEYEARQQALMQHNVDLKIELNSLRKQMVDLDKKKSALEAEIYPVR